MVDVLSSPFHSSQVPFSLNNSHRLRSGLQIRSGSHWLSLTQLVQIPNSLQTNWPPSQSAFAVHPQVYPACGRHTPEVHGYESLHCTQIPTVPYRKQAGVGAVQLLSSRHPVDTDPDSLLQVPFKHTKGSGQVWPNSRLQAAPSTVISSTQEETKSAVSRMMA